MGDGFRVDPEQLTAAAQRFGEAARQLENAQRVLTDTLDRLGSCWGGDEQGRQFAASHLPNRQKLDDVLRILAKGVGSVEPALEALGQNFRNVDEKNRVRGRDA